MTIKNEAEKAQDKVNAYNARRVQELLQSLPSFAEDRDENQWKVLNDTSKGDCYTPEEIDDIQSTALKLYYTNPGASGLIETMVNFVIGKTATITPKIDNMKVQKFWSAFCRKNKWDRRSREWVRRAFRDGETFCRLFKPVLIVEVGSEDSANLMNKVPLIRFLEPKEINSDTYSYGIETDPQDVENVIRYERNFKVNETDQQELIPASDIVHTKIRSDSNMKRGISLFVGIAKYLVKYESWLNDRIVLNKIRTLFNVIMKVSGMSPTDFKTKFEDSAKKTSDSTNPSKKLPKPGTVLVSTPSVEYEMLNLNIRAQDTKDDGRAIELMIAKGTQLTEYIIRGDASNSNYSSTMVSESPMVRMFESWQDYFSEDFKELYSRVIQIGIDMGVLPKNTNDECDVNFPGLIHRDIESESKAIALQIASKLCSKKTGSETLGYNYDNEKIQMEKEEKEDAELMAAMEDGEHKTPDLNKKQSDKKIDEMNDESDDE